MGTRGHLHGCPCGDICSSSNYICSSSNYIRRPGDLCSSSDLFCGSSDIFSGSSDLCCRSNCPSGDHSGGKRICFDASTIILGGVANHICPSNYSNHLCRTPGELCCCTNN